MTTSQRWFGLACGLDTAAAAEGELRHDAAGVTVDDLAGHPGRAGRTLRPPVADAEATDLDRHGGRPGGQAAQRRRRRLLAFERIVVSGWA